jgi:hypothetical protein
VIRHGGGRSTIVAVPSVRRGRPQSIWSRMELDLIRSGRLRWRRRRRVPVVIRSGASSHLAASTSSGRRRPIRGPIRASAAHV